MCIRDRLNEGLSQKVKHIWIPHSLGALKKRNMKPDTWKALRVDERIQVEKELVPKLDGIASTSAAIHDSLKNDYGYESKLFLPPCVNPQRFYRRDVGQDNEIWDFLSSRCGLPVTDIKQCKIITEISRTDATKRKDVLIKAFAKVHAADQNTLLIVSIDDNEKKLSAELKRLIAELNIKSHVAIIGNEQGRLPVLYSISSVYCSPSVMEGFGMSVQEAAATKVPVVGSDLIPFVKEYLLGKDCRELSFAGMSAKPLCQGAGAFMVPADDIDGFAAALRTLVNDAALREKMGAQAFKITIPYFTWNSMTQRFLIAIGEKNK
jgi:glycosyltransferase involved in cell wall biosynthesis